MPDSLVRNPDMALMNTPDAPSANATVIACGHVLGDGSPPGAPSLPCYQALGPWGEPDAGLPWFRIGQAEGTGAAGGRSGAPGALADILRRNGPLVLIVGRDHDSLALALAIGTYARSRGIRVTALLAGRASRSRRPGTALLGCADHVCDCPAGLDPLQAAQALAAGVDHRLPERIALPDPFPPVPGRPAQN